MANKVIVKILNVGNIKFINKMGPIITPISIDENIAKRLKAMGYNVVYLEKKELLKPSFINKKEKSIKSKVLENPPEIKIDHIPDLIPEEEIPKVDNSSNELIIDNLIPEEEKEEIIEGKIEEKIEEIIEGKIEEKIEDITEEEEIEYINLDSMTKKQLLELAKESNLDTNSLKRKKVSEIKKILEETLQ
jgi:hypothetical protein